MAPPPSEYLRVFDSRTSREYEIPIEHNTVKANDLATICEGAKQEPLKIFDPGFAHTAIMQSSITKAYGFGSLTFRGYEVGALVSKHDFDEVAHLLIFARLPSTAEKTLFRDEILRATQELPESVAAVVQSFPPTAPHLTVMVAALSAALGEEAVVMPVTHGGNLYNNNLVETDAAVIRVLGTYSACLGLVYSQKANRAPFLPESGQSFVYNVFKQTGLISDATGQPDEKVLNILDRFWVAAADHELAHSTSTLLMAASALGDPLSCVISALTAGFGILHLGAVEVCYRSVRQIGRPENVASALADFKSKKGRMFGIGHRVYKTPDPRIGIIKETLQRLKDLGYHDPLLAISEEIERQVSEDEWFVQRSLYVNPDLFHMFIYTSLGIPIEGVGPLFFGARLAGLMAHYRELMSQKIKLWRPNQVYVGQTGKSPAIVAQSKL